MYNANGERMMAWIAKIDKVTKHPNADSLDICSIGGWEVVSKLGEFKENDLCIYISIDSWVPTKLAPFLSKGKEPREYMGVKGERLRTVRLRGQISQGLILPISYHKDVGNYIEIDGQIFNVGVGQDVTELLGIQKWEAPINPQMAGFSRGNFPSHTPKTDAERIQHLTRNIEQWYIDKVEWEVTEKLHGTSMTVFYDGLDVGCCSRNINLKLDQEGNLYVDFVKQFGLLDKIQEIGDNVSIQGELVGSNIQPNAHYHSDIKFYIFNIWDIDKQKYYTPDERMEYVSKLNLDNVLHCPVIYDKMTLPSNDVKELLKFADGESVLNKNYMREGFVWKSLDGKHMFKTVSNLWLEKYD